MRAYVNTADGLNVRNAPNKQGKIIRAIPLGGIVDVDQIVRDAWSKVLNTTPQLYVFGQYLSPYDPDSVFTPSVSYSKINLHGDAGGWPPRTEGDKRAVHANRVDSMLVCGYEPQVAYETISTLRNLGVKNFIIRAVAPRFPKDGAEWAKYASSGVAAYTAAIGTTRNVMIQLHNEPNLTDEGWLTAWNTPAEYNKWFLRARQVLADTFKGIKIGFSPMSPGVAIANRRYDERSFLIGCKAAIAASDWFATHCYYGRDDASDLVIPAAFWRQYAGNKPIVCTEAGPSLNRRATPEGVTNMFKAFAKVRVPAFAWLLNSRGQIAFRDQAWGEIGLVLPVYSF